MRVLSINNTADRYGASRCMERVFGPLAEAGHEIHAVLPENGHLATTLRSRGVHVHVYPGIPVVDRNMLKSVAGCVRFALGVPLSVLFLVGLILRLQIDIVHTNTVVLPSPSLAAFVTRRPHVWHVRELLQEFGSLWRPYQRWVCSMSSAVVAISSCVRDQFEPHLQHKVKVIYDGLDQSVHASDPVLAQAFRNRFSDGTTLVGVVGRIKWHRKGQEVLVRAAALLRGRFPGCRYAVVGAPSLGNEEHETRLRALIAQHGLENVIRLVGEIEDTASVFTALDIAVAPSVQPEPFGCVVIEAMASRAAVVGSRAGGIAEQIVHGETGLLFTPGDAEDLARQLEVLLADPAYRRRMALKGESRVRSHFKLASTVADMLTLFESLISDAVRATGSSRAPGSDAPHTGVERHPRLTTEAGLPPS